jgi:hypothetical protein
MRAPAKTSRALELCVQLILQACNHSIPLCGLHIASDRSKPVHRELHVRFRDEQPKSLLHRGTNTASLISDVAVRNSWNYLADHGCSGSVSSAVWKTWEKAFWKRARLNYYRTPFSSSIEPIGHQRWFATVYESLGFVSQFFQLQLNFYRGHENHNFIRPAWSDEMIKVTDKPTLKSWGWFAISKKRTMLRS